MDPLEAHARWVLHGRELNYLGFRHRTNAGPAPGLLSIHVQGFEAHNTYLQLNELKGQH